MSVSPILKVEDLKMHFPVSTSLFGRNPGIVKAVDGVSLEIAQGETFGLVGESGCGKTTVGKCILRILRPTAGKISYNGKDITHSSRRELGSVRREIQMIFQDPYGSLDPRQSAGSIIKEAITCGEQKYSKNELADRVDELLTLVELYPHMKGRFPHEMSGGQRQRLGIARTLACDPKLIVCDEPVSALDVSIQAQIINLFWNLQKKLGLNYLFVAHDLAVVRHIAETIGVMYLGKIVEVIDAEIIYTNPMHPYTKALLSAVPTTDYHEERQRSRVILQGEVPSPMNVPSGCPFHPRCPQAIAMCKEAMPQLKKIDDAHSVACHNI